MPAAGCARGRPDLPDSPDGTRRVLADCRGVATRVPQGANGASEARSERESSSAARHHAHEAGASGDSREPWEHPTLSGSCVASNTDESTPGARERRAREDQGVEREGPTEHSEGYSTTETSTRSYAVSQGGPSAYA